MNRVELIQSLIPAPDEAGRRAELIHDEILSSGREIRTPSFTRISSCDLRVLFEIYDRECFHGTLHQMLTEDASPLVLESTRRLTRAAGNTTRRTIRARGSASGRTDYRIGISAPLLFATFDGVDREINVNGLVCHSRLEALQRVFEHELIHLAEHLSRGETACAREPFQAWAFGFFGHTAWKHGLVRPAEHAAVRHGIRPGDRVSFDFKGGRRIGLVNRIGVRVTVLVPNADGFPFSDGERYTKYLVPIRWLTKVEASVKESNAAG
jgi:hypothetical protein